MKAVENFAFCWIPHKNDVYGFFVFWRQDGLLAKIVSIPLDGASPVVIKSIEIDLILKNLDKVYITYASTNIFLRTSNFILSGDFESIVAGNFIKINDDRDFRNIGIVPSSIFVHKNYDSIEFCRFEEGQFVQNGTKDCLITVTEFLKQEVLLELVPKHFEASNPK